VPVQLPVTSAVEEEVAEQAVVRASAATRSIGAESVRIGGDTSMRRRCDGHTDARPGFFA
jgi:hypothetical protein